LDAADNQAAAFGDAVSAIDGYTSKCSVDFHELSPVRLRLEHADDLATTQLHDTWYSVEEELGLLVSKIADRRAFHQLVHWDAASVDLDANRSAICVGGSRAKEVVLGALLTSLRKGLAAQTWMQLQGIFVEMEMLNEHFISAGLNEPSNKTRTQARGRASDAFQLALSDLGNEVGPRIGANRKSCIHFPCGEDRDFVEGNAVQDRGRWRSGREDVQQVRLLVREHCKAQGSSH